MVSLLGDGGDGIEVKIRGTARDLSNALNNAATDIQSFKQAADGATADLDVDDTGVKEGVARAKRQVESFDDKEAEADLGVDAGGAIANLQLLKNRADAAEDEIDDVGDASLRAAPKMAASSASSVTLSGGLAAVSTSSVGAAAGLTTVGLAVAPLLGVGATLAVGFGALAGAFGAMGLAGAVAAKKSGELGPTLNKVRKEVMGLVQTWGEQFKPLLLDAIKALPKLVKKVIKILGPMDKFKQGARGIGQELMKLIPQLVRFGKRVAEYVLPAVKEFLSFMNNGGMKGLNRMFQLTKKLVPKLVNLGASVLELLGPATKLGTKLLAVVIPALDGFVKGLTLLLNIANKVINRLTPVANAVMNLGQQFGLAKKDIKGATMALGALVPVLLGLGGPITWAIGIITALGLAWDRNLFGIRDTTRRVMGKVKQAINGLKPVLQSAKQFITRTWQRIKQRWDQNVKSIFQTTKQKFRQVWQTIKSILTQIWINVVKPILDRIQKYWRQNGQQIQRTTAKAFQLVATLIGKTMNTILAIIQPILSTIQTLWQMFGDEIKAVTKFVMDFIMSTISFALDYVETLIDMTLAAINGNWSKVWNEIKSFNERTWKGIVNFVDKWATKLWNYIKDAVSNAYDSVKQYFGDIYDKIKEKVGQAVDEVEQFKDDLIQKIETALSNALEKITSWDLPGEIMSKAESAVSDFASSFDLSTPIENAISSAQSKIDSWTPDWPDLSPPSIGGGGGGGGGSNDSGGGGGVLPGLDSGGMIEETGIAQVHKGEAVIPEKFVDAARNGGGDGGGKEVNVNIDSINADSYAGGRSAARGFKDELRSHNFD